MHIQYQQLELVPPQFNLKHLHKILAAYSSTLQGENWYVEIQRGKRKQLPVSSSLIILCSKVMHEMYTAMDIHYKFMGPTG